MRLGRSGTLIFLISFVAVLLFRPVCLAGQSPGQTTPPPPGTSGPGASQTSPEGRRWEEEARRDGKGDLERRTHTLVKKPGDVPDPRYPKQLGPLPNRLHMLAVVDKTIDAGKLAVGDPVRMTVARPELDNDVIVVPQDSKLFGRVVEVVAPTAASKESRLVILVERIEWKGQSLPLYAFIVAQGKIGPSPTLDDSIKLEMLGNPPLGSALVSHKGHVRLQAGTVLVLRNVPQASGH